MELPTTGGSLLTLSEADWPVEYALSRDSEVIRWTFYPSSIDEAAARDRCRSFVGRAREGRSFRWIITTASGSRVGTCGAVPRGNEAELFYALLSDHRGLGLATEAVTALANEAARLTLTPQLAIESANTASTRVAMRAGFRPSGERHDADGVLVRTWRRPFDP
jgi:RimJ/RimL family protein N-acetyltransferase